MRAKEVEARWGIPLLVLLKSIADQGLNMKTASRITGMKTGTIHAYLQDKEVRISFENSPYKSGVAEREGRPFWEFVTALAEAGASKAEAAKRTGASLKGFQGVMQANPDLDPFKPTSVARTYLKENGETIVAAAKRMVASGMGMLSTARAIGYSETSGLRYALNARGVNIREFVKNARMGV